MLLKVTHPAHTHHAYTAGGCSEDPLVPVGHSSTQLKLNEWTDKHGRTFIPDFWGLYWQEHRNTVCITWALMHFILFSIITQLTTFPVSTFQCVWAYVHTLVVHTWRSEETWGVSLCLPSSLRQSLGHCVCQASWPGNFWVSCLCLLFPVSAGISCLSSLGILCAGSEHWNSGGQASVARVLTLSNTFQP